MTTTVLFDLFGTLIHFSRPGPHFEERSSAVLFCENFGTFDDAMEKDIGHIFAENSPKSAELLAQCKREVDSVKIFGDTIITLEELKSRGITIGLISNIATPFKACFYNCGLDKYIKFPGFSCDMGCKKPDPQILRLYSQASNLEIYPSKTIFVGDRIQDDIELSRATGMRGILIDRQKKCTDPTVERISSLTELLTQIENPSKL